MSVIFPVSVFVVMLGLTESSASSRADVYDFIRNRSRTELIPVENDDHPMVVGMSANLASVNILNEVEQYISVDIFLSMRWRNELIRWDPSQFGNVTSIFVPLDGIWTPDIGPMYTYGHHSGLNLSDKKYLLIKHTGDTFWYPSGQITTYCPINTAYFPFDVQECTLIFGSWNFDSRTINIYLDEDFSNETSFYRNNSEWKIEGISSTLNTETKHRGFTYPWILFTIKLERRSTIIIINTIAPILILSIVNIGLFRVRPETTDKVACALTILLSFSVVMSYISTSFPRNGERVPYLTIYVGCVYIMSSTIVLLTAMTASLSNRTGEVPKCCIAIKEWTKKKPRINNEDACDDGSVDKQMSKITWHGISRTVDALFFWIFALTFAAGTLLYFCVASLVT